MTNSPGFWRRCYGGRVRHFFFIAEKDLTLCGKTHLTAHIYEDEGWKRYPRCKRCVEKLAQQEATA